MPYWAVAIIIAVLVVGYYLLTQQGRARRRERLGVDFAKVPNFYANQIYTSVNGDTAVGIDDRGRRIAVSRKHTQPRTRVYSFAHIVSAEVMQNGTVIAAITAGGQASKVGLAPGNGHPGGNGLPGSATGGLFGSTRPFSRRGMTGLPVIRPEMGLLTMVGVRVTFRDGGDGDTVLTCFYDGKAVNVDGVAGERAFAEAQVLLGSLDVAMKRAGTPPRGPVTPKTPVL
jgi:hypothetical protein